MKTFEFGVKFHFVLHGPIDKISEFGLDNGLAPNVQVTTGSHDLLWSDDLAMQGTRSSVAVVYLALYI